MKDNRQDGHLESKYSKLRYISFFLLGIILGYIVFLHFISKNQLIENKILGNQVVHLSDSLRLFDAQLVSLLEKLEVKDSLETVAIATQIYWNACHELDLFYEKKLETAQEIYGKNIDKSEVELYKTASEDICSTTKEWMRKERALPIVDVDPELTKFFSKGRKIFLDYCELLLQEVQLLSKGLEYDSHEDVPEWLIKSYQSNSDQMLNQSEKKTIYINDWENLRLELTQRYRKEFSAE